MENKRDNSDELLDAILGELGRLEDFTPAPTKEQTARWGRALSTARHAMSPHAHSRWRIFSTYAAAAAVLIMAVLVGVSVSRNNLTADEVFVSVNNSVNSSSVIVFSLCDLKAKNHLINMEFMGSNTDGSMYVDFKIRPSADIPVEGSVRADVSYISKDSKGILLIRSLFCGKENILADMDPKGKGVVLRFDNVSNNEARARFLPGRIEMASVRQFIDSLKNSSSDFQISNIDASRSEIFGVIDKPQNMSTDAIMQSATVASYANKLLYGVGPGASNATMAPQVRVNLDSTEKMLMGTQAGPLLRVLPKRIDKLFRFLTACQVYRNGMDENSPEFIKYRNKINDALNAMRVSIIYDRKSGMIQRVTLKDSNDVSVNIRFTSDAELGFRIDEIVNVSRHASDMMGQDIKPAAGK